jgi:hypothetical protein
LVNPQSLTTTEDGGLNGVLSPFSEPAMHQLDLPSTILDDTRENVPAEILPIHFTLSCALQKMQKRRSQNRNSQRMFRERQKQRFENLEGQLEEMRAEHSCLLEKYIELKGLYTNLLHGIHEDLLLHVNSWQHSRLKAMHQRHIFDNEKSEDERPETVEGEVAGKEEGKKSGK